MKKSLKFHFYNTLCSQETHNILFEKYGVKSGNAAQYFFGLIARGLSENNSEVYVNSVLPINPKNQKNRIWTFNDEVEDNINFKYIPVINISILKNLFTSIYVFFDILFKKYESGKNHVIIVDFLRFGINFSVFLACKIKKIKTLSIVTDLPGEDVLKETLKKKIRNKFIFRIKYDYYICVTEALNLKVNESNRPNLIIEGFTNVNFKKIKNTLNNKFKNKVIVYAGGLYERYGIKSLIEGFMMCKEKELRLWLYGTGPFVDQIKKYNLLDSRIIYKGVIPHDELIPILVKSTLLVNPRPSHEDFTKFSFPSKNLEYMSVGTPLLTTKLPGIPIDHYPYIYLINNESKEGIFNSIKEITSKNIKELNEFGLKCKEYTYSTKNNVDQAKRIMELIKF